MKVTPLNGPQLSPELSTGRFDHKNIESSGIISPAEKI
jgi:hypothetical protein